MTEVQLFVIAGLATLIVFVIKFMADKGFDVMLHRGWLTAILFVISLGLAVAWQLPIFPAVPVYADDPAVFAGALITFILNCLEAISPLVAFATLIYNALGKKVFEDIGRKIEERFMVG